MLKLTYCSIALLAVVMPLRARAQAVLGAGEDATVLPAGSVRFGLASSWTRFYDRYGHGTPGRKNGAVEPLGVDFSLDTIGVAQFENLSPVQAGVRVLSGMPDFTASLGKSVVRVRDNVLATPLAIDLGLTRRVTIGVLVPFVTAISDVDFRINPAGREATLGFNPTLGFADALSANALLLAQFDSASASLSRALSVCAANPAAAGCGPLNANAAAARSLLANSAAFAATLAQVYGGRAGSKGAAFVPITGSAAQTAIEARIAGFRSLYAGFGQNTITVRGPRAAQSALTIADVQRVLTDSAFGVRAQPLATSVTRGIGDINVALKVNLFDTFGRVAGARLVPRGFNWRQSVGGVYRLGTGRLGQPDSFTGLGTGNHQSDVEARSFTDLLYGAHFWVSIVARYDWQMADQAVMRVTQAPSQAFPAAYRQQTVRRNLGDVFDAEISPRWVINDFISVTAQYYYRRKFSDRYTGTFSVSDLNGQPLVLDASSLDADTGAREHRFGGGLSYSTVAAFERKKARFPLDVTYYHYQTTLGSGGRVPKLAGDQVQLRLYGRLFGR